MRSFLCFLIAAVVLIACRGDGDGDGATGPEPDPGPMPARLAFASQPGETELHQPLVVEVAILDEAGNPVPGATNEVTVTLGANPGSGALSGATTVSALDGVARFEDLALDRRGSGYTLVVSADGLEGAESEAFDVTFGWMELSAGGSHTCGRTRSGVAYCWGNNEGGQLGNGIAGPGEESDVPLAVATDLRFVQLTAGGFHTCGVTPDDEVYCWGDNDQGQLGDGRGGIDSSTPRRVEAGGVTGFEEVSAGGSHTCALTPSGSAFCWGNNSLGQLGDGNVGGISDLPVAVDTDLTFLSVTAGGFHNCALAGTDVHCWGDNTFGQLGDGTFEGRAEPVPVQGDQTFVEVGAGSAHSCALTLLNQAFCWGENGQGQLGDGNAGTDSQIPIQVTGEIVFQVPSVTVGASHACAKGFGLGSFCWGANSEGQLGDGFEGQNRDEPTAVEGDLEFSELNAGSFHTCGLTPEGEAFCWGNNSRGRLGDGNAGTDRDTPVRVLDPPKGRTP